MVMSKEHLKTNGYNYMGIFSFIISALCIILLIMPHKK